MVVGTLPNIGSNAKVLKGGAEMAYCQGVTVGAKAELIKQWVIGDPDPKMIKVGHKSYPITIDGMLADFSFLNEVLAADTTCTVQVYPGAGTESGEAEFTLSDVRFNDWELTMTEDGPVLERVAGEAEGLATGTAA
jgi:hypothetical protein